MSVLKKGFVVSIISLILFGCGDDNQSLQDTNATPDEEKMQETRDRVLK